MNLKKNILLCVVLAGCTASGVHPIANVTMANQVCVDDCRRIQNECRLASTYPSVGSTCVEACVGVTFQSPVDPEIFCYGNVEIEHWIACETCLLGDTGGPVCDFSSQFDPASMCYNVCQPIPDDVRYCGHMAL